MFRIRVNFRLKLLIPLTVCLRDHCGVVRRDNRRKRVTNREIAIYLGVYARFDKRLLRFAPPTRVCIVLSFRPL